MDCRESRRAQNQELRGGPRPAPGGRLAAHLSSCDRCRRRWDESSRTIARLRSAYLPVPRVDVVGRVMARVHQMAPLLVRDLRLGSRQLTYSLGIGTLVAAAFGLVAVRRAPEVLRETPITQVAVWVPRLMVEVGKLVLETVYFLVTLAASGLRLLDQAGDKLEFLAPASIVLTAILAGTLLAATAIAVRRDLLRHPSGNPWHGGKL